MYEVNLENGKKDLKRLKEEYEAQEKKIKNQYSLIDKLTSEKNYIQMQLEK